MTDSAQTVLILVLVVLSALLLILGVQVFFILKGLRETVNKANKILDDTGSITESVSGPISKLSNITAGIKTGVAIASLFGKKMNNRSKKRENNE